ncbi:hypothetical protein HYU89_00160 [Candidatus Collierbacteria bacterium]|nr:hypothetical protein [Candidatus Collierbacteria bacterium]
MENLLSGKQILNFNLKAKVFLIATAIFVGLVLAVRQPGWLSSGKKLLSGQIESSKQVDKGSTSPSGAEPSSAFWAVYLDSGQVFYGKKGNPDKNYVTMTDVFYYQPGVRSTKSGNIRIIKVGTEIHQPQDYVYVNKLHIERQEQLSSDSKVVKAIEQYGEGK